MDIQKLKKIGKIQAFKPGETIIYQGLEGNEMYIILKGRVEVFVLNLIDGTEATIAELETGAVFGEMSLFQKSKRSASIRALEPCTLFSIDKSGLDAYMNLEPKMGVRLLKTMAKRLVSAEENIKTLSNNIQS